MFLVHVSLGMFMRLRLFQLFRESLESGKRMRMMMSQHIPQCGADSEMVVTVKCHQN